VQSQTITRPLVSAAHNGPGTPDVETYVYDIFGRTIWSKDADGFIGYNEYDQRTGALTKAIADVDTSRTADFIYPPPWTTPTNGGLHLVTRRAVDSLGRTTKLTDANGNVTYTAYNDATYEVRTYPGWNNATGRPTGPTQVSREDRSHSVSYTETWTVSAAPHLAPTPAAPALAQTSGGTLPATTYFAKVTYVVNGGETAASPESSQNVAANFLLQVSSPPAVRGATGYNVYIATASGQEVLQNGPTPVPLGATGTEPAGGLATGTGTAPLTGNVPDGTETVSGVQALSRRYTNASGQLLRTDAYFNLSDATYSQNLYPGAPGAVNADGTVSGNYWSTLYGYDVRGRQNRVEVRTGTLTQPQTSTITRTDYDGLSRVVGTWVGTNDTTLPNLVQVSATVYDNGTVGDSNVTQTFAYPKGPLDTASVRETDYLYDWRDRLVLTKQGVQSPEDLTTHRPIQYSAYDNLGEVVASEQYDGDGVTLATWTSTNGVPNRPDATRLRAKITTQYDDQRRVYQTNQFSVDQGNGTVSTTSLNTNNWYDHRGNLIKTSPPGGQVTKTAYDGAGRVIKTYTTDEVASPSWTEAGTVANNNVLSQTETQYDAAGNVIFTRRRDRFHNETTLGALGTPATAPLARVSYVASYYDSANRLTTQVDLGNNGGTVLTARPGTAPDRTNPVLRTDYGYQADEVQQVALSGSPTGGTFKLTFNSQTTAPIASNATAAAVQSALQPSIGAGNALVAGPAGGPWLVRFANQLAGTNVPEMTADGSGLTGGSVSVQTASRGGDSGRQQQLTDPRGLVTKTDDDSLGQALRTIDAFTNFAPSDGADRTTERTYDGAGHVVTYIAKLPNNVLQTTRYTYGVSGAVINSNDLLASVTYPGQSQIESYSYDALGETVGKTDRNGSTHSMTYDVLGRLTSDAVTMPGAGVDTSVLRLDTAYDTGGRAYRFTSYNSATATDPVANQVNQVQQSFNGLGQLISEAQIHGNSQTPAVTVQYTYSQMLNGQQYANHSRLTRLIYPNGRQVNYQYASGLDDAISRLTSLQDNGATQPLEVYSYLGLGTVVRRAHPEPGVDLTYIKQAGDPAQPPPPLDNPGDPYTGLDRFGRVQDQRWLPTASPQSPTDRFQYGYDPDSNRLYRANLVTAALVMPLPFGELYQYDALNQLTSFGRGTLTATRNGLIGPASRSQSWSLDALGNWRTLTTNDGITQTTQNRQHNLQNRISAIDPPATLPGYDANGNTTQDDRNQTFVYDAWNRLVRVTSGSNTVVYASDALGRRIRTTVNSNPATDLYYSTAWQVVEEQVASVMMAQYVWSSVYVDAMIERDTSGGPPLYVQQDANWNVTAVVDTMSTVRERYVYDPYAQATVLDPNSWATRVTSLFGWLYLHEGGRLDSISGLYNFRHRDYSPPLGRWMQEDPLGYEAGDNLYDYLNSRPTNTFDPLGMEAGEVQFTGATIGEAYTDILTVNSKDKAQQILDDLSTAFKVDFDSEKDRKKIANDKSLVTVYEIKGVVVASFSSSVRFSADLKGADASIIQVVEMKQTETSVAGKAKVTSTRYVEGWVVDDKGAAKSLDNHAGIDKQLFVKDDKSLKIEMNFTVGVGLYDGKKITGERSGIAGRKGFFDLFKDGDESKVKWCGPTKKYKVNFEVDNGGNWKLTDESTGVNREGKFSMEKKK
jgi:RHS repeat-associated protein